VPDLKSRYNFVGANITAARLMLLKEQKRFCMVILHHAKLFFHAQAKKGKVHSSATLKGQRFPAPKFMKLPA